MYPRPNGTCYICGVSDDAAPVPPSAADVQPRPAAIEALRGVAASVSQVRATLDAVLVMPAQGASLLCMQRSVSTGGCFALKRAHWPSQAGLALPTAGLFIIFGRSWARRRCCSSRPASCPPAATACR